MNGKGKDPKQKQGELTLPFLACDEKNKLSIFESKL
jgi:hypothetical protein